MENNNTATRGGIGITGLALLWALITQALAWAGVIAWPWYAIWGPFLISLGFTLIVVLFVFLVALAAAIIDRR